MTDEQPLLSYGRNNEHKLALHFLRHCSWSCPAVSKLPRTTSKQTSSIFFDCKLGGPVFFNHHSIADYPRFSLGSKGYETIYQMAPIR